MTATDTTRIVAATFGNVIPPDGRGLPHAELIMRTEDGLEIRFMVDGVAVAIMGLTMGHVMQSMKAMLPPRDNTPPSIPDDLGGLA